MDFNGIFFTDNCLSRITCTQFKIIILTYLGTFTTKTSLSIYTFSKSEHIDNKQSSRRNRSLLDTIYAWMIVLFFFSAVSTLTVILVMRSTFTFIHDLNATTGCYCGVLAMLLSAIHSIMILVVRYQLLFIYLLIHHLYSALFTNKYALMRYA